MCAQVTEAFLEYTKEQGNDLSTPMPAYGFPGLKPGDGWCLCAARWAEAEAAGCAPLVRMAATHARATEVVPLATLQQYAAPDAEEEGKVEVPAVPPAPPAGAGGPTS